MGTELPTKVMLGQTLVLMQMKFLNNVRKVGCLGLSRTSCFLMNLTPSHSYGYRRDYWRLKLNRDKETQKARVKALIITNYCGLSSLVNPDTVRHALCSYVKMDSWLIKQSKSVKSDIDILGATSSTVDGSPAEEKKGEKISNGLPDIRFYLSTRKRERASPVCCVW
jgi:hypothetical protein